MARKTVERNISYDDQRKLYYVSMDLGKDQAGRRIKRYQTYRTLYAARMGLRNFLTHREEELRTPRHELTLADWLESWMDNIVRPTRAETTVYGYQKIIDNHLVPALGDIPLLKLTPMDIQQYYIQVQLWKKSREIFLTAEDWDGIIPFRGGRGIVPFYPMKFPEKGRLRGTDYDSRTQRLQQGCGG